MVCRCLIFTSLIAVDDRAHGDSSLAVELRVADKTDGQMVHGSYTPLGKGRFMLRLGPRRKIMLLAAIALLIATAGLLAASDSSPPATDLSPDKSPPSARQATTASAADQEGKPRIEGGQVNGRWREGSRLIDQVGSFRVTGDHVTFASSDGKLKFEGLENLAIERIARTIGDSPDQLEWTISGIITEYRGANYLLVTQAVLKTKSTRPRRTQ
jgi:hypothetical protein